MTQLTKIAPNQIEERSFKIIENEFLEKTSVDPLSLNKETFSVIRRVIHATGDFSFARTLSFHPDGINRGIESIKKGRNIYFDVTMGASGVNKTLLKAFGGEVVCHIQDHDVSDKALRDGKTRTETALMKMTEDDIGIIAIGNAPTALVAAMDLIDSGIIAPDLIVGVPVGFVNASESKEILEKKDYPFITNSGRKGGTPVAVAIVNALIKLCQE